MPRIRGVKLEVGAEIEVIIDHKAVDPIMNIPEGKYKAEITNHTSSLNYMCKAKIIGYNVDTWFYPCEIVTKLRE